MPTTAGTRTKVEALATAGTQGKAWTSGKGRDYRDANSSKNFDRNIKIPATARLQVTARMSAKEGTPVKADNSKSRDVDNSRDDSNSRDAFI
jgi:hypothetical protein